MSQINITMIMMDSIKNTYNTSISRPLKKLQHFEKINLKPGEIRKVFFVINPQNNLSFPDKYGKEIIENGNFFLKVGGLVEKFRYN